MRSTICSPARRTRFAVRALHESGINGLASAVSPPVTPSAISGAPREVRATALASSALVRWRPPAADGSGGSILRYRVYPHRRRLRRRPSRSMNGPRRCRGSTTGADTRSPSRRSSIPGPGHSRSPRRRRRPPRAHQPHPGTSPCRSTVVSRVSPGTPPADTGESEIVSYAVRRGPDGASQMVPAFDRRATFTLPYRRSQQFTVQAANTAFSGPSSEPTESVSADVVRRLWTVSKSALRLGALVSWHAPPSNGGSKVDRYIVRSIPPGAEVVVKGDERVAELRGLKRGRPTRSASVRATRPASARVRLASRSRSRLRISRDARRSSRRRARRGR